MAKQTFTTGQVLTAAQMTSLQQTAMGGGSATAKTASYTLVAADAGTTVIMNSGSATTITVNTGLFAAGDTVFIVNQGAGICTITAGTATVTTAGALAMGANETGQLYFLSASAAIFTEYTQAAAASGGMTLISTTSLTGATVTLGSFSGYKDLQIVINGAYGSNANTLHARFNADSGNNYYESLNTVGTGEAVRNKATLGDGLSSSSTNVTLRNNTLLTIQRYAEAQGKAYQVESTYIYQGNTAIQYVQQTNNIWAVTTAITSIDLFLASGNFSGGTAYLYGVN